jgi:NADH:ubiquinone oxidoreductase subunit 5 (subunit L)/multisubunit Na+/H+ antiporter MnhA subunit
VVAPATTVVFPLGVLAAGIALQGLLAGLLSPRAKGWLAFVAGAGALGGVLAAWPAVLRGQALDVTFGRWDGPIQLAYHVDGLGFFFALMASGIGAAILLYAVSYMEHEKGTTRFYALILLFIAGLIHLVYTADLFLLYVSWELVGLCSFLLVSFWYRLPEAAYGARKVLTMTHLAGYGLFAAVVLLLARTGSTRWTDPRVQGAFTTGIFLLVLVASLAKSVQFPLHTWIANAMAAPTPVSALLHAACYVKAGVYLVARMHSLAPWPVSWGFLVSWIGAITLVVGALFMLAQSDLKRLLAFSTVSQIGYMMIGLGLGTPLGIAAGLLHCLNHGLFKGGLFLVAGSVQHACGTRDMDRLGGLGRKMPRTFALWLVGAAGIAGVPLLNGFVSKWLLYDAALEAHQPLLALVPWVGSILTVFAFLKATSGVFLGSDGEATARAHEVSWTMTAGGGALAAGCVVLGVAPQLAIRFLVNPLLPALGRAPLAGVSWFGLTAGQGAWFATGGLVLGVIALVFGAVVYWLPLSAGGAVSAAAGGPPMVFTGGEPLGPQGHLGASDFSQIVKQALAPFYRGFDVDRGWLAAWRGIGRFAGSLAARLRVLERYPITLLAAVSVALAFVALIVPAPERVAAAVAEAAVPSLVSLAAGMAVALAGLLLACAAAPARRHLLAPLAVAGGLAIGGVLVEPPLLRTALLEAAAAVALLALWWTSRRDARRGYLAAVVLSAIGMVGGALAAEHGHLQLARVLLLPGAAVKLGLVPLWFWLPLVAEATPAVVAGLVVGVVDVAAFAELLTLRGAVPGLFEPALPWLVLGVASAILGALLALAQRDLKRLLAFSTIEDMGLLVVALVLGGEYGLAGAALGATVHALAKGLLFASVAGPEAEGAPLVDARGLATAHPLAAAGFVVGALAVLGVPPTLGYAAHWRIFAAVAGHGPLLAALAGAAMLSVAIYARAIAVFWWGTGSPPPPARAYRQPVLGAAIVLLALALLAAGLWPQLLGGVA